MPLVLLFGQPHTGKHDASLELISMCKNGGIPCYEVSPHLLGFKEEELISRESELNKKIYEQVREHINQQTIVIVNHTNHLKSFRYELYCVAREKNTQSCVLSTYNVDNTNDCAKMPEDLYDDIVSRFEMLLEQSEWDNPVFRAAGDAYQYCTNPKAAPHSKKSTKIQWFKQIPMFDLLNEIIQRIHQQQSSVGTVCNVQLFDNVYFTCQKLYTVRELEELVMRFKDTYDGKGGNHEEAQAFKVMLESE